MSYIPASAMPHAKPHEENEHGHEHQPDGAAPSGAGQQQTPPEQRAETNAQRPATVPPTPASERQGSGLSAAPWGIALAVAGAIAIGATATALVLRGREEPAAKSGGKRSGKANGRKKSHKSDDQ